MKFTVSVRRTGKDDVGYGGPVQGYDGPIRVSVVDLPKGIAVKPSVIAAGEREGELIFTADEDAPREPFELVVVGDAIRDDGAMIRRVAERRIYISDAQMTHLPWNVRVRKLVCVVNR